MFFCNHQKFHRRSMIDIQEISWRTRGFCWDYVFVLRPRTIEFDNFYETHNSIFDGITPSENPQSISGKISTPQGEGEYLATCFVDKERKDEFGRPVKHYILWFPSKGTTDSNLPSNWGENIVDSICRIYGDPFHESSENIEVALEELFSKINYTVIPSNVASGDPLPIDLDVLKTKENSHSPPKPNQEAISDGNPLVSDKNNSADLMKIIASNNFIVAATISGILLLIYFWKK